MIFLIILFFGFFPAKNVYSQTPAPFASKVILMIWDGTQKNHLQELLDSNQLPNLRALINEGRIRDVEINTQNCQCTNDGDNYHTDTGPAHAAMLSGYGFPTTNNHSNWDYEDQCEADCPSVCPLATPMPDCPIPVVILDPCFKTLGPNPIPQGLTFFERLKEFNPNIKTGLITGKAAKLFPFPALKHAAPPSCCYTVLKYQDCGDNTTAPIDTCQLSNQNNDIVANRFLDFLNNNYQSPFFLVAHLKQPDNDAHVSGENSSIYTQNLISDDQKLGDLINKLKELGIYEETVILVTTDHGMAENGIGPDAHHVCVPETKQIWIASNKKNVIDRQGISAFQTSIVPTLFDIFGMNKNVNPPFPSDSIFVNLPKTETKPSSIGQCQATNLIGQTISGTNTTVSWGYPTFFWPDFEPTKGVYNWEKLDSAVRNINGKIWIQVSTSNPGVRTIPSWATDVSQLGNSYYDSPTDNSKPVQWDPDYKRYLNLLVQKMAERYDNNNGDNAKIEAVLTMSGGNYGEMSQTVYCFHGAYTYKPECCPHPMINPNPVPGCYRTEDVFILNNPYIQTMAQSFNDQPQKLIEPYTDPQTNVNYVAKFDYYYVKNTLEIIDIYASAFKNKNIVIQLGSGLSGQLIVAQEVARQAVEKYGKRVWLKQNGWGERCASSTDCLYPYFPEFAKYKDKTRTIFEVGQPGTWRNAGTHNALVIDKAINQAGASAVCFQSEILNAPTIFPINYKLLREGLQTNYQRFLNIPSISPCTPKYSGFIPNDFNGWKTEFFNSPNKLSQNFNCDSKTDLVDFEIFRRDL